VRRAAVVLGVVAWLLAGTPAGAALLTLTEAQQAEALRFGERSVIKETGFDAEWRVDNATGHSLIVMTPFYRLMLASRNAAFKNELVKPQDQEKLLKDLTDRLMVWVQLHGPKEDFARYYKPRLLVADREIEPAFVQNERTGLRQANGSFLARSVYAFPNREITGQSRLDLMIRDPDGKLMSRFAIDLGKMR
jgi:hypothetical protein